MENEVAFYNYVVTWKNIKHVTNFENHNLKINNNGIYISIIFKNSIPPALYFYKNDEYFVFSFLEEELYNFIKSNFDVTSEINEAWQKYMDMEKKKDIYLTINKYKAIQYYCLYENMKIYYDGHVEYDKIDDLFTVDIHDSAEIVHDWLHRTQINVNDAYSCGKLCSELSSGLDTRSLTHFWRDKSDILVYTKNDMDEIPTVKELINTHFRHNNIKLIYDKKLCSDKIKLSGKGADLWGVESRFMSIEYVGNYMSLHEGLAKKYIFDIVPYCDRQLMRIKADYIRQFKIVMQYLLARDLMDINYYSFKRRRFLFTFAMEKDALKIIKEWKLEPFYGTAY